MPVRYYPIEDMTGFFGKEVEEGMIIKLGRVRFRVRMLSIKTQLKGSRSKK